MEKFRKECIGNKYYILHVYECPTALLKAAVELAEGNATVENVRPNRSHGWFPFDMQLFSESDVAQRTVRCVSLDIFLTQKLFQEYFHFWDRGVYAVFTNSGPIPFRASDLKDIARYKALTNFNWSLELAIPGSNSSGWGHIASPDPLKIELLFAKAMSTYNI